MRFSMIAIATMLVLAYGSLIAQPDLHPKSVEDWVRPANKEGFLVEVKVDSCWSFMSPQKEILSTHLVSVQKVFEGPNLQKNIGCGTLEVISSGGNIGDSIGSSLTHGHSGCYDTGYTLIMLLWETTWPAQQKTTNNFALEIGSGHSAIYLRMIPSKEYPSARAFGIKFSSHEELYDYMAKQGYPYTRCD